MKYSTLHALEVIAGSTQTGRCFDPPIRDLHGLINRGRREQTAEFGDQHRVRSGIKATNSLLKRVTGLDRLRVRGGPAVFSSILLKVAGWNLLRAASVRSLIAKLTKGGQAGSLR